LSTPYKNLSAEVKNVIMFGSGNVSLTIKYKGSEQWRGAINKPFEGIIHPQSPEGTQKLIPMGSQK
jgi:excinuclease UvrABC ATPase subunit